MGNDGIVNETEIRKAVHVLKPDGMLFEVRIIGQQKPISGYFRNADDLICELEKVDLRDTNVYITPNHVNSGLASRKQSGHFLKGVASTSDTEIDGYRYFFIDIDPKRPSGISSSDKEYNAACEVARKIYLYLKSKGFEDPVKAVSGNGAHLLYRISLANNMSNIKLVERCLKSLDLLFSDDVVQIDTSNFNPSRVCKLYGTLAQKGLNTEERPHRMSRIINYPEKIKITDVAYLENLAREYPEEQKPRASNYNNYNPKEFDIEGWMSKYGLRYSVKPWRDGCTKYILDNCPFDYNHKSPDSMILVQSNGAISFKCLHNSCQNKTWRDVRLMFEPDAYSNKANAADARIEAGWQKHNREKQEGEVLYAPLELQESNEPLFETIEMILNRPEEDEEYIETGITIIDKKMRGLKKRAISTISGLRGSAKSTTLSQISLNAVNRGQTVICYSGELSDKNFAKWMFLQAAGKANVVESKRFENFYYVDDDKKKKIAKWMGEKFWLYNNRYGNNFNSISQHLVTTIQEHKADLVILDNLMALDIRELGSDKYDAQTAFVQKLKDIANLCNVHIIFVAHPRKASGFLRLDDIAGSGNLTNYVDNAFIVHRKNKDFDRLAKEMFKWNDNEPILQPNITNVIEICKDRDNGNQDEFIPLYYEKETKRLKNTPTETVIYGWDEDNDGFYPANEESPF